MKVIIEQALFQIQANTYYRRTLGLITTLFDKKYKTKQIRTIMITITMNNKESNHHGMDIHIHPLETYSTSSRKKNYN